MAESILFVTVDGGTEAAAAAAADAHEWGILFTVHNECASTTEAQNFSSVNVAKHACTTSSIGMCKCICLCVSL